MHLTTFRSTMATFVSEILEVLFHGYDIGTSQALDILESIGLVAKQASTQSIILCRNVEAFIIEICS